MKICKYCKNELVCKKWEDNECLERTNVKRVCKHCIDDIRKIGSNTKLPS